jgi:DNA-binding transcriptional regulator YbjK
MSSSDPVDAETAILGVLECAGPHGVTHAAVAKAAGIPEGMMRDRFPTVDDLLVCAMRGEIAKQADVFEPLQRESLEDVAVVLLDYTTRQRRSAVAQYELMMLGMRRDSLRDVVNEWYVALEDALRARIPGEELHTVNRRRMAAWTIDGLLLSMLWRSETYEVGQIVQLLERTFRAD